MKQINKYIQYIIFISIVIFLIASIFEPGLFIWLLFIALPIGFTQYITSLIDVIMDRNKSRYKYHFILSTLVLVGIYFVSDYSPIPQMPELLGGLLTFIGFAGSFAMALYYWGITYRKEPEIMEMEHDVFDL